MPGKTISQKKPLGAAVLDRVSTLSSAIRRASFMSAAATALVAGSPMLYSRALAAETTTVVASQQAASFSAEDAGQVQDLLNVPLATNAAVAMAVNETAAGADAINFSNDAQISEDVLLEGEVGDVNLVNTGDVMGGIDVTTGKFREQDSTVVVDQTSYRDRYVTELGYDATQGGWISLKKAVEYKTYHHDFHDANSNDAAIRITNQGSVNFSGDRGISAKNESGALIDITNSGDISSATGAADGVGIFADTTNQAKPYSSELVDSVVTPGVYEYTYAPDWQGNLTQYVMHKVVQQGYRHYTYQTGGLWEDRGDIVITNDGSINLNAGSMNSTGILTASPGSTNIVNNGDIQVGYGRFAKGIQSYFQGDLSVTNNGSIHFGNRGTGIDVRMDRGTGTLADLYHGGDTTIINTGDIVGGTTRDELLAKEQQYIDYNSSWNGSNYLEATGMFASSFGSNGRGNSSAFKWANDRILGYYERYDLELPTEGFLFDAIERNKAYSQGVEFYSTTVINAGNITLGDGGEGVKGSSLYGQLNLINTGTITVGDGATDTANDGYSDFSAGMSSHWHYGSAPSIAADIYMLNDTGGIISTGDDGIGMAGYVLHGSLDMVNRGDIQVGDGLGWEKLYYGWDGTTTRTYFAPSYGIRAQQLEFSSEDTQGMAVSNAGTVSTGDMSHGIAVTRMNRTKDYYPQQYDAIAFNTGSVTTGNNSTGMSVLSISDAMIVNTGDINIGSFDGQAFADISDFYLRGSGYLNQGMRVRSQYANYLANDGAVNTGSGTVGIYSRINRIQGFSSVVINGENGDVNTGDQSTGVFMMGGGFGQFENAGTISVGDNSVAVDTRFFGSADHQYYTSPLVLRDGGASIVNTGDIVAGDLSIGVGMTGAYYQGFACAYDPYGWSSCDESALQNTQVIGTSSMVNYGNITVGEGSTAVEISGKGAIVNGFEQAQLVNLGNISAGEDGIAIKMNTPDLLTLSGDKIPPGFSSGNWLNDDGFGRGEYVPVVPDNGGIGISSVSAQAAPEVAINSTVMNYGTIKGDIWFGAGDDTLINASGNGQVGTIVMNDNTIGFGAGNNTLYNLGGVIRVTGGDNLITGANVVMINGEINAVNNAVDSTLTIDGNVSGNFVFAADISNTASDQLIVNGDMGQGSSIGLILNPAEQMSGEVSVGLININGDAGATDVAVLGVSGAYADTLLDAYATLDANGQISATAVFGMGHMTMATTAATSMLQNWWMQSMTSFDKRNSQWLAGNREQGLSLWGGMAHDEGTVSPEHSVQDASFDQLISGTQFGFTYSTSVAGAQLAVGPSFSKGQGRASLNANTASATSDAFAFGLNASLTHESGIYLDAAWQKALMRFNFTTPDSALPTTAKTEGEGTGFNIEAGYRYDLESGLSLLPQIQYSAVDADLDDFASSNGIYRQSDVGGKATRLRAGMSLFKSFTTTNGSITPLINLSYLNATQGESQLKTNGVDFGTDTSGAGYSLELGLTGSYRHWDIGVRLGASDTSATDLNLSTNVNIRYHW